MAIKIGVIGCGRILNAHLRGFRILQEAGYEDLFQITALCARKEEDALRFRKRGEGPSPRPNPIETPGDPLNTPHTYVDDLHPEFEVAVYTDYKEMLQSGDVDAVVVIRVTTATIRSRSMRCEPGRMWPSRRPWRFL